MAASSDKHKRILEAATQLFGELGYSKARIETIAEMAGVAKGTVYLYFKNKPDLFASCIENRIDELIALLETEIEKCSSATEAIRKLIEIHVKTFDENMGFADLVRQNLVNLDHILRERLMARHYQARQMIEEWVGKICCPDSGITPSVVVDVLIGATTFAVASIHLTNGELDTETLVEELTALLAPGITGQFA